MAGLHYLLPWIRRFSLLEEEEEEEEEERGQSHEMKATETESTTIPYLPHHLLVEILLKLPFESLLRFRCVSKSWLSLISNSHFTKAHLNQSITKRILMVTDDRPQHWLYADLGSADKDIVAEKIDFDIRTNEFLDIVGSCNGLVCLWFPLRPSYVIFNPSTRESKTIPACDSEVENSCGFGYDDSSDDYKLVKLARNGVYVYSLRTDFWKKVQDYAEFRFNAPHRGTLLNGTIHWLCWYTRSNKPPSIAAFDLVDEKLSEIPLPSLFTINAHEALHLEVFGGCLSVKQVAPRSDHFWVMKEYGVEQSWTIDLLQIPNSLFVNPLALLKNDETLITTTKNFILYNIKERTCRNLALHGMPKESSSFHAVVYVESLVSPCMHDRLNQEASFQKLKELSRSLLRRAGLPWAK